MAEANPKTSAVIITSPHCLSDDQVARIKAEVALAVPVDVGVAVLGGLKVDVVGGAPVAVDMVPGELVADGTQAQILAELKAVRAAVEAMTANAARENASIVRLAVPLRTTGDAGPESFSCWGAAPDAVAHHETKTFDPLNGLGIRR